MGRWNCARRQLASLAAGLALGCSPRLDESDFEKARLAMVFQLEEEGIRNADLLEQMRRTPRHLYLPGKLQPFAYEQRPLPIGYEQALSAPQMIAQILELANPHPEERALELRTGCGYQTALLAGLCKEVYTTEIVRPLWAMAKKRFAELGHDNIECKLGPGSEGWAEKAPFDLIVAYAAAEQIPQALLDQLAEGGRMVIPVGDLMQTLVYVEKKSGKIIQRELGPVKFGPMLRQQDLSAEQK